MTNRYRVALRASSAMALAAMTLVATPVLAQAGGAQQASPIPETPGSQLDDIVVTATKTGTSRVQDTPLAISAFGNEQLKATLSSNVRDLAQFIPSLNISQVTTNPVITLRGVGTNNVFNGSDPDVTVQVDGVYLARPSAQTNDFLDIERVEVLRGPQGTLYGRNAIGGTINVISRQPTENLSGEVVLTGGNYGTFQGQAYASGAIVPNKILVSIAGTYTRHDDYETNINPNATQHGVFNANRGGVRGQVRLELTDRLNATTRADFIKSDEDLPGPYSLRAPFPAAPLATSIIGDYSKVSLSQPSTSKYESGGLSEEINYELTQRLNLKSITAIRYNNYALKTDNDATELNNIVGNFHETEHQHTQEFDLSGKFGKLDAVAGAYFFDERAFTDVSAAIISPANIKINSLVNFSTTSYAGFGQGTYHLTPTINLTAGLRYTTETKGIDVFVTRTSLANGATLPGFPIIFQVTRDFHAFTPKFGIDWKATPNILLYASATKGYKSGGTNYAANSPATASFDPETIWSYEGGIKGDFLDRRLRVNLTGFHYDYSNLQIQSSISPGVVSIGNAAQARVDGAEAEITAKLSSTFHLDANASWLNARYSTFTSSSVAAALKPFLAGNPRYNAVLGTYDASGNKLNQAPRFSGTIAATNDFNLASGAVVTLRGDVYYSERVYYDPQNTVYTSQGPYAVVNAQLSYTTPSKKWQVILYGKNIANRLYLYAFQANGVEPAGFGSAPRTYGVRVNTTF